MFSQRPLFTLCAVLLVGCGPARAMVQGRVTLNGQPVEKGAITFTPTEGKGVSLTAGIKKGEYQLSTVPGKHLVQITAPAVVGRRPERPGPDAPMVDLIEERLPPQFNINTVLSVELLAGENTKDWTLEVKGVTK